MTTRTENRPWDLSHVLDLVNSLSTVDTAASDHSYGTIVASPPLTGPHGGKDPFNHVEQKDFATPPSTTQLGDFAKVWQFLGSPLDSPASEVPLLTNESIAGPNLPTKDDYVSDGATYFKTAKRGKGVQWQDQQSADEPATDSVTDRSASPETPESPTLTKTQRKKLRRKETKAKEAAQATKAATVSESEADSTVRRTPARKASAHVVSSDVTSRYSLRPRDASGMYALTPSTPTPAASIEEARARVAQKLNELRKGGASENTKSELDTPFTPPPKHSNRLPKQQSQPSSVPVAQRTISAYQSQPNNQQQWPVSGPSGVQATQQIAPIKLVPSTVQPPSHSTAQPFSTPQASANVQTPAVPATRLKHIIEPKIVRSGEDRHWALLMKLISDFYEDRKHIISPMNLTTHNNNPHGIHVFVDASNIFIGFTEQLKRSRNIPPWAHVPHVDLSFDALALLMERRRPVAKRVLVGSTPHLPAFDKAKAVGYECSILEKVYKARELTERQIYFKENDRYGSHRKGAKAPPASSVDAHGSGGTGSGSETSAPQYAPARMIEQGVDEILHLKILESVVDSETPSTIVLATGDAAQAEYSQGFMAMVERALKKGWKVELVSWSKNVSMSYRKREWVEAWGAQFRVVFLDDYAEELLDM